MTRGKLASRVEAWATALQLRAHRLAQRLPCAGHGEATPWDPAALGEVVTTQILHADCCWDTVFFCNFASIVVWCLKSHSTELLKFDNCCSPCNVNQVNSDPSRRLVRHGVIYHWVHDHPESCAEKRHQLRERPVGCRGCKGNIWACERGTMSRKNAQVARFSVVFV